MFGFRSFTICALLAASASFVSAAPSARRPDAGSSSSKSSLLDTRQDDASSSSDKLVFCHFMIGIISDRTSASDYDSDMQIAKDLGIDAFALNIGTDDFTDTQLGYAYDSAANNDMKVFISFDFNWFSPTDDATKVGEIIANYSSHSAQLKVDGKVFASSFSGDGLDVSAVKGAAGTDVYFAPNFSPDKTSDVDVVDGALNWMGWDSNGDNKAPIPGHNVTVVQGDIHYNTWLGTKSYIAPVSPWFSTHYGIEVSYSKNFVFPSDLLWQDRWDQVLEKQPQFVEIITWNDYGESHYIGPLSSKHYDDGASKWVNDMPHDGFRDVAKPYIAAYKAGASSPDDYVTEDKIVYWYRPHLSTAECDSTDNTIGGDSSNNASGNYFIGKPNGYEELADSVFVVTMLTADGSLTVTSGDNTQTFEAKAGVNSFEVDMGVGQQKFSLTRDTKTVLSGTSLKEIQDECICGIYNFNAYVGTLPEQASDPLDADGLASFTVGLHVTTCSATPSLGTPTAVAATTTGGNSQVSTHTSVTGESSQQPTTTSATASIPAISVSVSLSVSIPVSVPSVSIPSVSIPSVSIPSVSIPVSASVSASTTAPSSPETTTITTTTTVVFTYTGSASPSSASSSPYASASATSSPSTSTCNGGTNADDQSGNFMGLCSFSCSRGYCPSPACKCTSTGTPTSTSSDSTEGSSSGCGLAGEEAIYDDLCAYTCKLGYCPDTACTTSCSSSS